MKNLEKSYVNSNIPKYFPEEKPPQEFPKEEDFIPEQKSYIEEVEGLNENYPYLFKPFKTFFNYIHNILKKEYKL